MGEQNEVQSKLLDSREKGSLTCENYPMLVLRAFSNLQVIAHHNRLRSRVASGLTRLPPATNMLEVHWDEELAKVAQRLADQCVFDHDCSECRRVGRFSVGQNLYQAFTTRTEERTDWVGAIDSWFNEIELLPISSISSFAFSPSTGHFTQLAWASTNKIGCGVTQYPSGRWAFSLFSPEICCFLQVHGSSVCVQLWSLRKLDRIPNLLGRPTMFLVP